MIESIKYNYNQVYTRSIRTVVLVSCSSGSLSLRSKLTSRSITMPMGVWDSINDNALYI